MGIWKKDNNNVTNKQRDFEGVLDSSGSEFGPVVVSLNSIFRYRNTKNTSGRKPKFENFPRWLLALPLLGADIFKLRGKS